MKSKLYALLLEDIKRDAELLREILTDECFDLKLDVVDNKEDYIRNLHQNNYDIIYADFTLPMFNGEEALELAKKICPTIPFICISGTIGEDKAVELLKQGATDYVLKDRMERLAFATKRAVDAIVQLNKFRQTEIELQTNRRLLQTIINKALDSIYIKDMHGKYLLLNEAFEKAFGKKASEIIGKDDTYLFTSTEARSIAEVDRKIIESGTPVTLEEEFTLADGNKHIFLTIKCPMFDDYGRPSGLFGIARDITERKQMENSLIIAKEKAEESDRLKTAFLHNISHEIRTPMNAIVGFSSFLKDPALEAGKRNHFLDVIAQSCNQLLDIITDIVHIATLQAGQAKVTLTDVRVNTLLQVLHIQLTPKAQSKNISFDYICGLNDDEAIIRTDQTKLTEILSNIINNSLKFTHQGYINFGYTMKDNFLEFYVADSGIGIPAEMHEVIFERFRQVNMDKYLGGTGLGLSISKGYVELLGGKIWLTSQPEKGTIFYFTIPYKQSNPAESSDTSLPKMSNSWIDTPVTILIAEDEEYNFLFLKEILRNENVTIVRAQNGQEAVDKCRSNRIDIVLMDMKMPVMSGFEATRVIKSMNPRLPVIAQTAYTNDKNKAIESGCDDFISKPITKNILIDRIKLHLNK